MDDATAARVRSAQARIDAALHERQGEGQGESARSSFSSYIPAASTAVQGQLWTTPATGRIDDVEEILDRFERLVPSEDVPRLQHALTVVLTHHPTVAAYGLRLPTLDERSPSKAWPSKPQP